MIMRKFLFLSIIICLGGGTLTANALRDGDDDDIYYTPKKETKQALKENYEREERERFHQEMQARYDMLMRYRMLRMAEDSIENRTPYSSDSIASDVIEFTPGTGVYPDSIKHK
jgi:hypothetical protein